MGFGFLTEKRLAACPKSCLLAATIGFTSVPSPPNTLITAGSSELGHVNSDEQDLVTTCKINASCPGVFPFWFVHKHRKQMSFEKWLHTDCAEAGTCRSLQLNKTP